MAFAFIGGKCEAAAGSGLLLGVLRRRKLPKGVRGGAPGAKHVFNQK